MLTMEGIKLLLVVLCLTTVEGIGYETENAAEGDIIHIKYTTKVAEPVMRYWYRFEEGEIIGFPPNESAVLFEQNEWGHVTRRAAPKHMVIAEPSTFKLHIAGIRLSDGGNYVAGAKDLNGVISYALPGLITVHIQPDDPIIHTFPAELTDLSEGQILTVTCTIPRLYPAITRNRFVMAYNHEDLCPRTSSCEFNSYVIEGDLAMRYTLSFTKILSKADKYGPLYCGVVPVHGKTKSSKVLFMNMKFDGVKPIRSSEL